MLDDASVKIASFKALFDNMIFLSTLLSLCGAQVLKGIIHILNGYRKRKRELVEVLVWRTGGMPSSHAAVVSSLCTSIAFVEGISSNLFVFSFWFALVVLRDAMGVRLSTGLLAKGLNNLGRQVSEKTGLNFHPVKEIQGHTPMEVVIGGLLGIFIATGLHLF
ncbi:MAG: divergent PAP2 family protein [Treponema sp.]|jgi:acid phosphatase family membrane protein YuiD|nr:divergent PAP2 family protein [Treponema sp.]